MSIAALPKLKVNNTAPDFHLNATDSRTISIGQFKQRKNVVLYLFGEANCGPCRQKLLEFKENENRLPVLFVLRALHAIEIECPECDFFPGATSI